MSENTIGYKTQKVLNITSIRSIAYFDVDSSFSDNAKSFEEWELVYVDRGECYVSVEEEPLLLHQGELYFHKPFENHFLHLEQNMNANIFSISFRCASVAMRFFENKKIVAGINTKQHISAIIHEISNSYFLPFNSPQITGFEYKSDKFLWAGDQTIFMRLELMLIELIRADGTFYDKPNPFLKKEIVNDDLCLKVFEYMELHINEKLSMEDLSRALSFSKSYISKRFASVCGCTIIDYFNQMKINEAKRLIRDTNRTFFEISDMLMFSNSHYFSNTFKKHTGMTPTEYKKVCMTDEKPF